MGIGSTISSWRRSVAVFAARFARARRGNVAMIFALALPPLILMTLGGVDIHRASTVRVNLQDALDAATLAAARSNATEDADIQKVGLAALKANLAAYGDVQLLEAQTKFTLNDDQVVIADARVNVKTLVANIVLPPYGRFMDDYVPVAAHSEVNRSSKNLEVALVLDITGSMNNGKIDQLKSAAKELVDIVVQDLQTPFYSKMSVVPYSVGVNVGGYAAAARGEVAPGVNITNAQKVCSWWSCTGVTVTSNGHPFNAGDRVYITGVRGMTQLNNRLWTIASKTTNSFTISVNSSSFSTYSSGGTTFCTELGCQYYAFTNAVGDTVVRQPSTCVSERTGSNAYTDAYVSSAKVGWNYDDSSNRCPSPEVLPLDDDRTAIKSAIDALAIGGSTAGQIGTAWGWYTVAPTFAAMWPSASDPGPYNDDDLLKAVILMTDGDFNTPYCEGVIARDAGGGSGSGEDHINCNATNGDPFTQAQSLCTAMKAKGILVYTVGFQVPSSGSAANIMKNCATGPEYAYLPASGADLTEAFKAIGRDITRLRISK